MIPIELLDSDLRTTLLLIGGGSLLALLGCLASKRPRCAGGFAIVVCLTGGLLLLDQLMSFVVHTLAPPEADFNEYRWVFLAQWGRPTLIAAGLTAIATVAITAYTTWRIRDARRWTLIVVLRFAAVATAMILFLQPAVELRQVAHELNHIAVLVDSSASMELADGTPAQIRRQRARQIIENSRDSFAQWTKEHIIDFYSFSDQFVPSDEATAATAKATGNATLLRQALEQLQKRTVRGSLAGVIVLSDGTTTGALAELGEGEFRDFALDLDAPIHTVWAGSTGLKDLAIADVRASEVAFVRTVTKVDVVVKSTGYRKRRIPVTLSTDGKPMRRKWITVGPNETSTTVTFEFSPSHVGKYVYQVSVPIEDKEAVTSNNEAWFVVPVIRDKIRVLLVAGQPSKDVRALRGMLKQKPNVDLISFFILRTPNDIKRAPDAELSLIPFPTRELFQEELPSFDLIILQNFNFAPYDIGRYLDDIRSYVEGGGGLAMLGGPLSFGSGSYANTPVAKVLPVELPNQFEDKSSLLDEELFRPTLTHLGEIHPITSLVYTPVDNQALWKSLPRLEGVNKAIRSKRGAAVLAAHPTLRDQKGTPMPVVVTGLFGKGRSLAVMTDSLWRWDFIAAATPGNDGRYYVQFWDNAIRWLIQDPELDYLHVDSDRLSYTPNMAVRLTARLLNHDYTPLADAEISLTVSQGVAPAKRQHIAKEKLITNAQGEAVFELANITPGIYRVDARATVQGRPVAATDVFLVNEATPEQIEPAAKPELLQRLSEVSGGRFFAATKALPADLPFSPPKVVRVDNRSDVALWNSPWLLLFALTFVGLEWVLRQRGGTL